MVNAIESFIVISYSIVDTRNQTLDKSLLLQIDANNEKMDSNKGEPLFLNFFCFPFIIWLYSKKGKSLFKK